MMIRPAALCAVALLGLACGDDAPVEPGPSDGGAGACAEDEELGPDGTCHAVLFATECEPGTMATRGQLACQPVGWLDCPAGFAKDPSGWGCVDVLPESACAGATRDALGFSECQPIGDCDAAFPPSDASLFVDDSFADAELDGSHFRTIRDAIQAAASGAVVAIEAGEYEEVLNITRPITLVGRCPSDVTIRSGGIPIGIDVAADAVIRGVSLRDHRVCLGIFDGASLDLVDSLVESCLELGVGVEGAGSHLRLERSVVRDTQPVSSLPSDGFGVQAVLGASVDVVDSALVANVGAGLLLGEPGTAASLTTAVIRDTQPDRDDNFGVGINALGQTAATVVGSALVHNHRAAINASGSEVSVQESVLRDTAYTSAQGHAFGVIAIEQAHVTVSSCSLTRNQGAGAVVIHPGTTLSFTDSVVLDSSPDQLDDLGSGIYVFGGSSVTLDRSALIGSHRGGLEVYESGSLAGVSSSLIRDGVGRPNGRMGVGVATAMGGTTILSGSTVQTSLHSGVFAWSGGRVEMEDSIVSSTSHEVAFDWLGHGILAMSDAFVRISGSTIAWNEQVGAVFTSASGQVSASALANNAVGIHVQGGSELREVDAASADAPAGVVEVTVDTDFVGNGSRVGGEEVVVPEPPDLPL